MGKRKTIPKKKKRQLVQHFTTSIDCTRQLAQFLAGGTIAFYVQLRLFVRTERRQLVGRHRQRPPVFTKDNGPFLCFLVTSGSSRIKSIFIGL